MQGNEAATRALLEAGADVELKDGRNQTALELTMGDDDMAKLLINASLRARGEAVDDTVLQHCFNQFVRATCDILDCVLFT